MLNLEMKSIFSLKINVYYEDTDESGYVYHTNYIKYAERARTEMLKEIFPDFINLLKKGNFFFVVKDLNVNFIKLCTLFDELHVNTRLKELKKTSLILNQRIYKKDTIYCEINVRLVWIKKIKNKPSKINIDLMSRLNLLKKC